MNNDDKSDSLAALARDLHARNSRVPDDVAERLRLMRQNAVTQLDKPRRVTTTFWVAGGFATTAAAVLVTIALLPGPGTIEPLPMDLAADELAAINELDVLEDLEFLAWMEEETSSAASG